MSDAFDPNDFLDSFILPEWNREIPHCQERCPSHDGKRCELLGHRPDTICEPAVSNIVRALRQEQQLADSISPVNGVSEKRFLLLCDALLAYTRSLDGDRYARTRELIALARKR
jgi:hypothetical protein